MAMLSWQRVQCGQAGLRFSPRPDEIIRLLNLKGINVYNNIHNKYIHTYIRILIGSAFFSFIYEMNF